MSPRVAYIGKREIGRFCLELLVASDAKIVSSAPDLVFHIGGGHIFTPAEIDDVPLGIINLHLAPLPEYRGRFSYTHAILNRAREFGATLHYVDEGIDTGPIIAATRFPLHTDDTAWSVYERAQRSGRHLLKSTIPRILDAARNGARVVSRPQNEAVACYYDRHSLPDPDGTPLVERALAWQ